MRWNESLVTYWKKYRYFFIVILAGIVLMLFTLPSGEEKAQEKPAAEEGFNLEEFEEQICSSLSAIEGVGRIEVMLSLETSEESVYASDVSQSSQSSGENSSSENYQSTMSILSDGSYGETPVLVTSNYPTFRGAVVICDGADSSTVRLELTEALSSLCGISSDHISVLKMSQ